MVQDRQARLNSKLDRLTKIIIGVLAVFASYLLDVYETQCCAPTSSSELHPRADRAND